MYKIRNLEESDLAFVEKENFIFALQLRYCGDYDRENAFSVVNDDGEVSAVAALARTSSWYAAAPGEENELQLDTCYGERFDTMPTIVAGAREIAKRLAKDNPDKRVAIIAFVMGENLTETEFLLKSGFGYFETIPVLSHELPETIFHKKLPDGIEILPLGREEPEIDEYLAATALANCGRADSKAEYMFRSGGGGFMSFKAVCGKRVVGGISVWDIGEDGGATENIFTIPEFRNRGIASELIMRAFEELKQRGKKVGTLSMLGSNRNAMRLYLELGYKPTFYIFKLKLFE